MKKLIYSSSKQLKPLVLAKGLILSPKASRFQNEERSILNNNSLIHQINNSDYYYCFTEAEYDPKTDSMKGWLVNHDSLLNGLGLPGDIVDSMNITPFSVDLNPSHSGTALNFGKGRGYNKAVVDYLSKIFNVGLNFARNSSNTLEWLSTNSSEFKNKFHRAANRANKVKDDLNSRQQGSTSETIYPIFAMCIAVIDTNNQLGVVADDSSFLIVANDYEDYKNEVRKLTRDLGYYNESELLFKTVFTDETFMEGDYTDPNTPHGRLACIEDIISVINQADPNCDIELDEDTQSAIMTILEGNQIYTIYIDISSTVNNIKPNLIYNEHAAELLLPTFIGQCPYTGERLLSLIDTIVDNLIKYS